MERRQCLRTTQLLPSRQYLLAVMKHNGQQQGHWCMPCGVTGRGVCLRLPGLGPLRELRLRKPHCSILHTQVSTSSPSSRGWKQLMSVSVQTDIPQLTSLPNPPLLFKGGKYCGCRCLAQSRT